MSSKEKNKPKKSVLMTPDPYHTPGYGGFCPQFKYQIGETFGRTTSRLLHDVGVSSSGKLVLARLHPSQTDPERDAKLALIQSRTQSWGDQKLVSTMIPGYTGFIPKSQHYFGKRYAENSLNAISTFEQEQKWHKEKSRNLRELLGGKVTEPIENSPIPKSNLSLAGRKNDNPFISQDCLEPKRSPYRMGNEDPEKRFMSGYTGFVPRSRGHLGVGYPLITNAALVEFSNDQQLRKLVKSAPVEVNRPKVQKIKGPSIYPIKTGHVPHYTGHIPGGKFRFGLTFGASTTNALNLTPAK